MRCKSKKPLNYVLLVFAALIMFFAAGFTLDVARADEKKITVAAAASLTSALKEIAANFEKETGTKAVISLGSTGMLTKQIREGAPFDVFFAADVKSINELNRDGFVMPDTVEVYAKGAIVLAVNKASGITALELLDLLKPGIRHVAIANPEFAPYGKAAMEALQAKGLWESVRLVYGENIRQALQFIQAGNAEAGIISLSIADVPEVSYTAIAPSLHKPINQAAAVVKTTREPGLAKEFIRYVNGKTGRLIMKKYGFLPGGF